MYVNQIQIFKFRVFSLKINYIQNRNTFTSLKKNNSTYAYYEHSYFSHNLNLNIRHTNVHTYHPA